MAKVELPANRGTEAFDKAVKKITDSVRAQRNQFLNHRSMGEAAAAPARPVERES